MEWRRDPRPPWLIGARFAIDRKTGALLGPEKSLWSFADSTYTVLAPGNSDNAFIVVATSAARGGGSHVTVINVQEYEVGTRKPFAAISSSELYSGICE